MKLDFDPLFITPSLHWHLFQSRQVRSSQTFPRAWKPPPPKKNLVPKWAWSFSWRHGCQKKDGEIPCWQDFRHQEQCQCRRLHVTTWGSSLHVIKLTLSDLSWQSIGSLLLFGKAVLFKIAAIATPDGTQSIFPASLSSPLYKLEIQLNQRQFFTPLLYKRWTAWTGNPRIDDPLERHFEIKMNEINKDN